ncbi:MAG: hypothetical protein CVU11_09735 [Bacteroidetes bacterium HGW-Bacteroidetes-6]|jgi:tetratricopeptide (TPR) repeat protein|nr:MAG: hypothetical protein CVU11_09735 [Bacteroidetes bacterium HGW-Bacteroidetes-6]
MASKNTKPTKKQPVEIEQPVKKVFNQKLFIILLGILLYGYSVSFDYALDDTLMITGNKFTQEGIAGTNDIFTSDAFTGFFGEGSGMVAGGRYRPFTHFMFAVEKELFGFNPAIGHFLNIVFYILLLLAVFAFLKRLIPDSDDINKPFFSVPLVITALFAAHPLHTEVVANIKGRDEIITMLCSISSMILLIDNIKKPAIWRPVIAAIAFFIALLSKENAITWIAVFPFALWFFTKAKKKDYFITILALVVPSLVFLYIRSQIVGGVLDTNITPELLNNPFINSSKPDEIATVLFTWLLYLKLLIFPHPLTHDYYPKQIAITDFSNPLVWLTIALVIFSIVVFIRGIGKKSVVSFGLLIFWATFSIASNLLFNIGTFMNERFMFVPLLGFAIIGGYYFGKYRAKLKWLTSVLVILLTAYTAKTIVRSLAWKDNYTLFMTDVKTSTNSAKVNVSAAEMLLDMADKEKTLGKRQKLANEAIVYLNRAEKIHPTYFGVYDLRGKAWYFLGNFQNSLDDYIHCTKLDATRPTTLNNIFLVGQAAMVGLDFSIAAEAYRYLATLQPDSARNYLQLAIIYDKLGMPDESFGYINKAIATDSLYAPAWNKGGELYGRVRNDMVTSEKYLLKAFSLKPNDSSTLENLGVLYGILKKYDLSVRYLRKAQELTPSNKQIMLNLSTSYQAMNMTDSANYFMMMATQQK